MLDTKVDEQVRHRFFVHSFWALMFLLAARLISICLVPLNDFSEARYAEIARKMLETGNWVTPQHAYGVPFWAKPPMSTWLSAGSMGLFGVNEFAARLPGLLLSIGVLYLVWELARKHSGVLTARISTLILAGSLYFFLDAGTVMTDPSLLFCTTLSMVAFWKAFTDKSRVWSYVFFAGLGLGMLAKGPIALVLVGLPIFFWVLLRNQWVNLWKRLPWFSGSLLATVIALPWYVLAESRTPGFLNYFIVGEHINRFLHPGWGGDKYGHAHNEPWGMIWIFAIGGMFPWCILAAGWLIKFKARLPSFFRDEDGWSSFLLLNALAPLLFFTFASNIIYTYTFPSLPAFALLFAELWSRSALSAKSLDWAVRLSMVVGCVFLAATALFVYKPEMVAKTQKPIVKAWLAQHPEQGSKLVFWDYSVNYSAEFYSAGKAVPLKEVAAICPTFLSNKTNYLVISPEATKEIPENLLSQFTTIFTERYKDQTRVLLRASGLKC